MEQKELLEKENQALLSKLKSGESHAAKQNIGENEFFFYRYQAMLILVDALACVNYSK